MKNMKSEYGEKKGKNVYYALESEGKMKPGKSKEKASPGAMSKLMKGK